MIQANNLFPDETASHTLGDGTRVLVEIRRGIGVQFVDLGFEASGLLVGKICFDVYPTKVVSEVASEFSEHPHSQEARGLLLNLAVQIMLSRGVAKPDFALRTLSMSDLESAPTFPGFHAARGGVSIAHFEPIVLARHPAGMVADTAKSLVEGLGSAASVETRAAA